MKVSDLIRVEKNEKREEIPPFVRKTIMNTKIWDEISFTISPQDLKVIKGPNTNCDSPMLKPQKMEAFRSK